MQPNDSVARALCMSIHDVSPHTWAQCKRLVSALDERMAMPLTLLVVPHYHRLPFADTGAYRRWLDSRVERGDELALHGYVHLDEGSRARGWAERFRRNVYTLNEGEFSAIDADEARRRIEAGWEWFERHGWRPRGFVAPAWMMGAGAWQALREFPFTYTTTMKRFHAISVGKDVFAPSLVYTARNLQGRLFSMGANTMAAGAWWHLPLLRFGFHPADAQHPYLMAHGLGLAERLVVSRESMTKSTFAERLQTTDSSLRYAG